jgi:16S rRNA (cytosine967-C5)-methyltransferase
MALGPKFDVVLVDAPCTGTGVWRRRPESKWKLKPRNIEERQAEQAAVLATARGLTKPGGRLVYVTCSVLPDENVGSLQAFLATAPEFAVIPYAKVWQERIGTEPPASADGLTDTLQLTPASHGTDGFFVAVLERSKD